MITNQPPEFAVGDVVCVLEYMDPSFGGEKGIIERTSSTDFGLYVVHMLNPSIGRLYLYSNEIEMVPSQGG